MKRNIECPRTKSLTVPDVVNPFVHRLHLSTLDIIQIAIMSVTIAPIRLLMVVLLLLAVWPLAALGVAFRSLEDKTKPMTGWRRMMAPLIVLLCRGVFFMGGFHWITVRGKRASPKEAQILAVAPHSSFFDSLSLVYLDLTSVVAKSEASFIPIFGRAYVSINFCGQPLSQERDTRSCRRILRFVGRMWIFLFGFHCVKVKGYRSRAEEAPLACVAPHTSFFDAIVYFIGDDMPSGVTEEENAKIPLFGRIIEFSQPVLVRRDDPDSRTTTIKEIQRRSHTGGQWPQIFIFPEGTCTNRSCLITFKGGAFIPGVPVQPVCLRYGNKLDTLTWTWDGPGAYQVLWFTLCQFQNHLEIEFLPVYRPSQEEIDNPRLFAENVRAVMAKSLNIPVTDHTYDDCRLMKRAIDLELPMQTGIVEFQKIHTKLGLKFDDMKKLLDKYRCMDVRKTGQVTISEFAAYLHVPVSPAVEEMFAMYDRDGSGTIDFREYVIGLSLVSQPASTENTLRLAFEIFGAEEKGYISKDGFNHIMHGAFRIHEEDVEALFQEVDIDKNNQITFEAFRHYVQEHPEYAKLFTTYCDLSICNGHDSGSSLTDNGKSKQE